MGITYVCTFAHILTHRLALFACVPYGINTDTHVCITYIHFLFETDIIPKKTKQYVKTASNSGKKAIYLFALVGLFQKTEMTNGC